MGPHTELIESLPAWRHRHPQDRALFWVRITLAIVISGLLLCVVGSSRSRHDGESTPTGGAPFPSPESMQ